MSATESQPHLEGNIPSSKGLRIWLITGEPGSGKSTALSRIILRVRSEGYTVGGVLTREIRSHGEREGFNLIDVGTEETAVLATTKPMPGPRVGKYHVQLKSLGSLGVQALRNAAAKSDLLVCDEVGPMELLSPEFRKAVEEAVLGKLKPCVCVVHKRLSDPLIDKLKNAEDSKLFEVDYDTRDVMVKELAEEILFRLRAG